MRIIGYNIVPICFLALAAFMIWMKTDGWGWCIFGAIITAAIPSGNNNNDD
jgi:hypothetical protein